MTVSLGLPAKVTAAGLTPHVAEELLGFELSVCRMDSMRWSAAGERLGRKMGRRQRMIRASRPQVAIWCPTPGCGTQSLGGDVQGTA